MNMVISEHHLSATDGHGRTHRMTEMIARLAPGATVAAGARRDQRRFVNACQKDYPEAYDAASGYQVTLTPFQEVLGQKAQAHALAADGRRGVRPDHRVRQRREPDADARRAARARARGARGARRGRRRGCARLLLVENLVLALRRRRARARHRVRRREAC